MSQSLFLTLSNFDQNLGLDKFDYADSKKRIGLTLERILELRIKAQTTVKTRKTPRGIRLLFKNTIIKIRKMGSQSLVENDRDTLDHKFLHKLLRVLNVCI